MTRNVVSAVVLTLMLAFNGVAFAQSGGGNPIDAILAKLDAIQHQLDKLENASGRPAPTAHRVWVAPFWGDTFTGIGDDAHIFRQGHVYALNPGLIDASVRVLYVNYFTHGRHVVQDTASAGDRTKDLPSNLDAQFTLNTGWVIVASDRPVMPYGWFTGEDDGQDGRNQLLMQFYPIDCTDPADDTVSRACFYADPANDPPK